MGEELSIGRLARRVGVLSSAIRHYEAMGLLEPEGRTAANFRFYGLEAVDRLRFIRAAQAVGFALDDIRLILRLKDGLLAPSREVARVVERRLDEATSRMEDLRQVEETLRGILKVCRRPALAEPRSASGRSPAAGSRSIRSPAGRRPGPISRKKKGK